MAKRKNGEGTWGKKTINGYSYHFYKIDGKYYYGKTIKEVKEKLKNHINNSGVDSRTTFGEYAEKWLLSKKTSLEPRTYDSYESIVKANIQGFKDYNIANIQLHNLSSEKFQKYLDALSNKYAHSTIQKIWAVIKSCVKYGELNKDLPLNTTATVNMPKESACAVAKKEIPFLNQEDLDQLYNALDATYYNGTKVYGNNARAIILIAYTGCRISEIIALKWKNYDKQAQTIRIEESASIVKDRDNDGKYKSYDKEPKTKDSNRIIPLPPRAIEMIEWFMEHDKSTKDNDYICQSEDGTKLISRNISRTLESMVKRCGLKDITPHGLRHTYGYILLMNGIDIKIVSKLLGHSDITTTYNIYIGVMEEDKSAAITKVFNQ